jgi:hypothetical protein
MFAQRGEEALEETEQDLFSDYVLTHHETQAIEQKEYEREEGEQGEEGEGRSETGAPMAKK